MKKITILTSTYNRAGTLCKLFESLLSQTILDFEWIVIDDGSTDKTESIIQKMIGNNPPFRIRYYYQENGGKHRAINRGLEIASGEYIFFVDSDDYLPKNSIEIVLKHIATLISSDKKFIGVSGLKAYPNGTIVGRTFKGNYRDCTDLERYKHNIIGDKAEVYKLDILKDYRFPEVEGENFITEAVLWNRIAKEGYYLRHFNEVIYYCEYLEDGLTKNIDMNFVNNFKGYTMYVTELIEYELPLKIKIKAVLAYCYRAKLRKLSIDEVVFLTA